jgi:hypothetical protein
MSRAQIFRLPHSAGFASVYYHEACRWLADYGKTHWAGQIKDGDVIWTVDPAAEASLPRNKGIFVWFNKRALELECKEENDASGYLPSRVQCDGHNITSPYHWVEAIHDQSHLFFPGLEVRLEIMAKVKRAISEDDTVHRYFSGFTMKGLEYPVVIDCDHLGEDPKEVSITRVRRAIMDITIPFHQAGEGQFTIRSLGNYNKEDPADGPKDYAEEDEDKLAETAKHVVETDNAHSQYIGDFESE